MIGLRGVGSGEWYLTVRSGPAALTVTNHSPLHTPRFGWVPTGDP